ncbi:MAG: flotillin-like FloA family protein [Dethiobacter sp.]|jgi:uncharacterized protein YqfA (UPF0365 family)|nr:flotillin-like FloA family protein [Dethiobacter sp.]
MELIFSGLVLLFIYAMLNFIPLGYWIATKAAGVPVSIFYFLGMRMRRTKIEKIVHPLITAHKAELNLDIMTLEAHYLAGGNVEQVVNTMIAAREAGKSLSFEAVASMDLGGGTNLAIKLVSAKGCK